MKQLLLLFVLLFPCLHAEIIQPQEQLKDDSSILEESVVQGYTTHMNLMIISADSQLALEVPSSYIPGKELWLLTSNEESGQIFNLRPVDGTYYYIVHAVSNLYVQSLPGSEMAHVGFKTNTYRDQWKLVPTGKRNRYTIINRESEEYLGAMSSTKSMICGKSNFGAVSFNRRNSEDDSNNTWRLRQANIEIDYQTVIPENFGGSTRRWG